MSRSTISLLLVLLCGFIAVLVWQRQGIAQAPVEGRFADRAGALHFGPAVSAADRALVIGALARARPQARALIERQLGAVTVEIGSPAADVAGLTHLENERFTVTLDLPLIYRALGTPGTDRLVMHEFGHVVDFALTPAELDSRLDTMVPRGYGCDDGVSGACATVRERFAESFSKWATGDIGARAGAVLGYRVPPPYDLEAWGRTLVAGAAGS